MNLVINCMQLSKDCKAFAKSKNMTFSVLMDSNGINNGYIANCRAKYLRESSKLGIALQKDCEWGICQLEYLIKICKIFELGDWKKYLHESELEKIAQLEQEQEESNDEFAQLKSDVRNIGLLLLDIRNLLYELNESLK